jgi:DNA-binding transcriptional LysR family regulator
MSAKPLLQRLPRSLKLAELRAFLAVLEQRSFRKAAAVLHVTQPAVTKAIAGLEELLGVRLFDRANHGVEPTEYALSLAPRAAAIFEELRRAAQDLTLVSRGARGTLRVGTLPMPAIPLLPIAMEQLTSAHPQIFATVIEGRETELIDRLRKRDIEVAILRLALIDPGEDMHVDMLFEERLYVLASKDHRLAARQQVTWPELLQERWVMPPADSYFYEHVRRSLDKLGLDMPRHVVETSSIHTQFAMVLNAGMLGFGMRSQIEFAPDRELLARLPLELPAPSRAVAAVSLSSHELSPLARQLVENMRCLSSTVPVPAAGLIVRSAAGQRSGRM